MDSPPRAGRGGNSLRVERAGTLGPEAPSWGPRWGQRLRGGRSGPPDWKLGAGACRVGKLSVVLSVEGSMVGAALGIGVIEQKAMQRLQPVSWEDDVGDCLACSCWAWPWCAPSS